MAARLFAIFSLVVCLGCNARKPATIQQLGRSPSGSPIQFFYDTRYGRAEAYLVRPDGDGRFPLVVLVHGHSWRGQGAERILPVAESFSSELCYASLAVSLPGYGQTRVPANGTDSTLDVLLEGIALARRLPWIDRDRVALYGFSRGATFAASLADRVAGLRGVVLQSGAYDIGRLYLETESGWVRRSISQSGEASSSFSVLAEISAWTAPTLVLHGAKDHLVPPNQALLLRERLAASGKPHQVVIFPEAGHYLPPDGVKDQVRRFLGNHVGSSCRPTGP